MRHWLIFAVRFYQVALSPLKLMVSGSPSCCRYVPTCSAYAIEALTRHGAARGVTLTVRRLLRCHPWGGFGSDPVPGAYRMCTCGESEGITPKAQKLET